MQALQDFLSTPSTRLELRFKWSRWTEAELKVLRDNYPNRSKLSELLPHRTLNACRSKWKRCWPSGTLCYWTGAELKILRRLYPIASLQDLMNAFPSRTIESLRHQAGKMGLYRPPPPFKLCGNKIIDTIKLRARAEKLSMRFLDLECQSGTYFRAGSRSGFIRTSAIEKALGILGGRLEFVWED